jgi:hypothetical protein
MSYSNSDLANAFPASLRDEALRMISMLPQPSWNSKAFSVSVGGEMVFIPYRIYHDPALIDPAQLTPLQGELLDCLLTRHHSGFVREKHLTNILCADHQWIPPFVVHLVGEYIIEILHVIRRNVQNLDPKLYREFLMGNPNFFALTKQRVISYWNCYHPWQRREDYDGFQIVEFFNRLVERGSVNQPHD